MTTELRTESNDTLTAAAPGRRTGKRSLVSCALPVLAIAVFLGLWEAYIAIADVEPFIFPAPSGVVDALRENWSVLWEGALVTGKEILIGLLISLVSGIAIGVVLHVSSVLRRALYPLLITSQTVPAVVLAPIFVIAFGFGLLPKLAIIWLICFFPIVVNTVDGLQSVDRSYVAMMRTLDASRLAIFRRVEFPSAVPWIFTGVRIAATYAAIGAVFGEWSGADGGLGYLIQQEGSNLNTPFIMAAVVCLSLITLVLWATVNVAQRVFAPWARER